MLCIKLMPRAGDHPDRAGCERARQCNAPPSLPRSAAQGLPSSGSKRAATSRRIRYPQNVNTPVPDTACSCDHTPPASSAPLTYTYTCFFPTGPLAHSPRHPPPAKLSFPASPKLPPFANGLISHKRNVHALSAVHPPRMNTVAHDLLKLIPSLTPDRREPPHERAPTRHTMQRQAHAHPVATKPAFRSCFRRQHPTSLPISSNGTRALRQ